MTHDELIERADKWLRNTLHCRVVFCEMVAYTRSTEIPDAIGFKQNHTILVECKTSVADFHADQQKRARRGPCSPALGNWRFYLTPPGLLDNVELPLGWGWYEVHNKTVKYKWGTQYKNAKKSPRISDWQSERAMLVSALARQQESCNKCIGRPKVETIIDGQHKQQPGETKCRKSPANTK